MIVLITGGNRGLGLEFANQFSKLGYNFFTGVRNINNVLELEKLHNVKIYKLDLLNPDSIKEFSNNVGDTPIDILINNAGRITHAHETKVDVKVWQDEIMNNALGPILLTHQLKNNILAGTTKKIIFISAKKASIGLPKHKGEYTIYRTSKAALNAAARSLSVDWKNDNIVITCINPGWFRSEMGGADADQSTEETAENIIKLIDKMDESMHGTFIDWQGNSIPW